MQKLWHESNRTRCDYCHCLSIGNTNQRDRIAAPPSVPETRVGFNDILINPDGRVRRNLMSASSAAEHGKQTPGIWLHAHMTSQILSTVLDEQPLFWFWAEWVEDLSSTGFVSGVDCA